MDRACLIAMLGILVHQGLISLPAADHYVLIIDKMLEDGDTPSSIDKVLGAING